MRGFCCAVFTLACMCTSISEVKRSGTDPLGTGRHPHSVCEPMGRDMSSARREVKLHGDTTICAQFACLNARLQYCNLVQ
eukprot:IDg16164t1